MHILYDENGNPISHGHDHCEEHRHYAEHDHCEEQDHCHQHEHDAQSRVKLSALLDYMLKHNQAHAKELDDLSAKLAEENKEAAGYIRQAADEFQKGNMFLSLALSVMQDQ